MTGQNTDSLRQIIKTAKHDSIKCKTMSVLIELLPDGEWEKLNDELKVLSESNLKNSSKGDPLYTFYSKHYAQCLSNLGHLANRMGNNEKAIELDHQSLKIQEEIGDKYSMAYTLNNIGFIYSGLGNRHQAIDYFLKSLQLHREVGDMRGESNALNNLGYQFDMLGEIPKALQYYEDGLRIQERIGDKRLIGTTLLNLGGIYQRYGDYQKAFEYYTKGLKLKEEVQDKMGVALLLNNLGVLHDVYGDPDCFFHKSDSCLQLGRKKALEFYLRSLEIRESIQNKSGVAQSLNNIAAVHQKNNDLTQALYYFTQSMKLYEELKEKRGLTTALNNIADIYYVNKNYGKALEFANHALEVAKEARDPEKTAAAASELIKINKATGNFAKALEFYEYYVLMNDSVNNIKNKKAAIRNQLKYDYEKEAAKDSIKNAEKMVQETIKHEEAIKQQRLYTYGGLAGFGLMLGIAVISFRAFRNKQKANLVISEQKQLVEHQKQLVEEKQKEILDSIRYAKRIQSALITNEKYIDRNLRKRS
jgi:tetratricopeptide (TPR) repeat protein